jgi:hypothetical protein
MRPRLLSVIMLSVLVGLTGFVPLALGATIKFTPNVQIGTWGKQPIEFTDCGGGETECGYPQLADYITVIYRYGLAIAGALAVMMIMIGGFIWLTSAGSSDRVSKGKEFITAAISGLVLAMFSFTLLYIINPRLVSLRAISARGITPPTAHDQSYRAPTNPTGTQRPSGPIQKGSQVPAKASFSSKLTGYTPENTTMEGGPRDQTGNYLRTLDDYLAGKVPFVSVAMDRTGSFPYGTVLNIPGLESALRNSGQSFTSPIPFVVVDNGEAFNGRGIGFMDICTENQTSANSPLVNVRYDVVNTGERITVDRGTHPLQN